MRPLCIDLFCGLGGWAEGFLAEGYDVIGFDIERHRYPRRPNASNDPAVKQHGSGAVWFDKAVDERRRAVKNPTHWEEYPGQLVIQDVLTLHGSQFKHAACIVASPPCQKYSYMAMPWKRSKELIRWYSDPERPERRTELNALFDACFRIQREASEAAGHHIPLVVENVCGAQRWVGRAKWHYGSYYLWGDVPALMPSTIAATKTPSGNCVGDGNKVWTERPVARLCDALKVPGMNFHEYEKTGQPGRSFQSAAVNQHGVQNHTGGVKVTGDWFGSYAEQKVNGTISPSRLYGKNSSARKAASAMIAKIPFDLAHWIARCYKPGGSETLTRRKSLQMVDSSSEPPLHDISCTPLEQRDLVSAMNGTKGLI